MNRALKSPKEALDSAIRRLQNDGRELSAESKAWGRDVAAAWLELDVRAMCERGEFTPDDGPDNDPNAEVWADVAAWRSRALERPATSAPRRSSVRERSEHRHDAGVSVCMQCPEEVLEAWRRRDEEAERREVLDDSIAAELDAGEFEARFAPLADVVELPRPRHTRRAA